MRLWSSAESKAIDQLSSTSFGVSEEELMTEAGRALARKISKLVPQEVPLTFLVGTGNNGGDGLVAARALRDHGYHCRILALDGKRSPSNQREHERTPEVTPYQAGLLCKVSGEKASVLVDGLYGIGLTGPLRDGDGATLLREAMAVRARLRIAIDVPSGVMADSIAVPDLAMACDHTITFGGEKLCHRAAPVRALCGQVSCLDIGFPHSAVEKVLRENEDRAIWLNPDATVPVIRQDAHKYDRGHVLVIGGQPGMEGAANLAGIAAFRAGAGYVTLGAVAPDSAARTVQMALTRASFQGPEDLARWVEARRVRCVVLGPGTGFGSMHQDVLRALARCQKALGLFIVIDAGALGIPMEAMGLDPLKTIITPHPGEWARMGLPSLGCGADVAAARSVLARMGVSALYKGATPFIFGPDCDRLDVIDTGGPHLAKAGSGDVLSGIIAAMGARGLAARQAAAAGQSILHEWGRAAVSRLGGREGLLADDLIRCP